MSEEFSGEPKLQKWLISRGFRLYGAYSGLDGNTCNWYACRRSTLYARKCEANYDRRSMQIVVVPFSANMGEYVHRGIEISLTGQAKGEWWKLKAYGLSIDELTDKKLKTIEASLIAAWNAL